MESHIKVAGHPLHPMLVAFPFGLLVTAVIFDLIALVAHASRWTEVAYYLIGAGVRMFADHPVLGVGFGGYQNAIKTSYHSFIPANIPNPDTVSHTAFVTIAAVVLSLPALGWVKTSSNISTRHCEVLRKMPEHRRS